MSDGSVDRAIDEWARTLRRAWWLEVASITAACVAAASAGLVAYRALVDPAFAWSIGLGLTAVTAGALVLCAIRRARPSREVLAASLDRAVGAGGRIATLATAPASPFAPVVERETRALLDHRAPSALRRSTRVRFAGALGFAVLAGLLGIVPPSQGSGADPVSVATRLATRAATALEAAGDRELASRLARAAGRHGVDREHEVERVLASVQRRVERRAALEKALGSHSDGEAAKMAIARGRGDGAAATAATLESAARDPRVPPDLAARLDALARAARTGDDETFAREAAEVRRATGGSAATLDAVRSAARALAPSLPASRPPIPIPSAAGHGPDLGATVRPELRAAVRRYFERVESE